MNLRYLILCFMILISNSNVGFTQQQSLFTPQFQNFYIGMSYKDVTTQLRQEYKATLQEESKKQFSMSIPVFELLGKVHALDQYLDIKNERVYYDSETFLNLKNIKIVNARYSLLYSNPFYIMTLPDIVSYSVDYPSRVNKKLVELKFKFFKNELYAVEYSAQLKDYELARIQSNYLNRYGVRLYKGDNQVRNDNGIYYVHFENNTTDKSTFTIMGEKEFDKIENYLDDTVDLAVGETGAFLQSNFLVPLKGMKQTMLQEKKNYLLKKLHTQYKDLDAL